jgi:hypothetical protein
MNVSPHKGGKMRKIGFVFWLFIWLIGNGAASEIKSFTHIFQLHGGLLDKDADGFADKIDFCIVIPDAPTPHERAAASEIAARANLESLVVDFTLVKTESEFQRLSSPVHPIFIGQNLKEVKKWAEGKNVLLSQVNEDQGLVSLFSKDDQSGVVLVAGSQEALLHSARAFFLRWPYLWDIWGREEGDTYFSLEEDISRFFKEMNVPLSSLSVSSALYEFPSTKSPYDAIKKLSFDRGEIKNLTVSIYFENAQLLNRAFQALIELDLHHKRGIKTQILSYPGCARITFELQSDLEKKSASLSRVGFPKRMLTPAYKPRIRRLKTGKSFDLTSLFTSKGFYSDSDKDGILDSLDAALIVPEVFSCPGIERLASRLTLHTAGASFPTVFLDQEVENIDFLKVPVLIGRENKFFRDLVKTGKTHLPRLENGWGYVQVVSQAFNKSDAVVIIGNDEFGLGKTLAFFSQAFPYFDEYGEGNTKVTHVEASVQEFMEGKHGSAQAHFWNELTKFVEDKGDKEFHDFKVRFCLPEKSEAYVQHIQDYLKENLQSDKIDIQTPLLQDSKIIFWEEKEFPWEGDEAIHLIEEAIKNLKPSQSPLNISIGVSESPEVRKRLKEKIENLCAEQGFTQYGVEALSSYKQGFFWIREQVIPVLKEKDVDRVTIRFSKEREDFSRLKRFYSEPCRWLQELYPIDEIIVKETEIPLDSIDFEMKDEADPVYEVIASDKGNNILYSAHFSPLTREAIYLNALPEWGNVKLTTGWVRVEQDKKAVLDIPLKSDLEKFWDYYQEEIIQKMYTYILNKTDNEPVFRKQPYFKKLLLEMWFSEPDYRLGLDEELISSLEALHDEIYFDTLDFIRGITELELEEEEIPEDTSRYSAPGNILPMIHPPSEGKKGRVKVTFEDWQARSPEMILEWEEKGHREKNKKFAFPEIKAKNIRLPSLTYNGREERTEKLVAEVEFEKEKDYMRLIAILDSLKTLQDKNIITQTFSYPNIKEIAIKIKHKDWEKEEIFSPVKAFKEEKKLFPDQNLGDVSIPTTEILSPQMCLNFAGLLGHFETIRSYIAGKSYENREIPVLEVFTPSEKYVSIPRLITFKPTLYCSGRQHANEVSSTNYILKFAELLAEDPAYEKYTKRMNFILHPMENPDGAELAYNLQKLTPFHSLHAGRYTSLGMDVGYQVGAAEPLLPEAKVRKKLYDRWLPDIYLNLHGYPSHEWIQQFSNYSPYLFRDYWLPRGWFAYYQALALPLYEKWKKAGEVLQAYIVKEINADEDLRMSNKRFYDRYYRWAGRWQPHMDYLEIHQGVNLYAKRRSSREQRLSDRTRMTFVEETPELMDETAQGQWLDFLCTQGLTYLRAHAKYLSDTEFEIARIEEEIRDRIQIQFIRSRPGKVRSMNNIEK